MATDIVYQAFHSLFSLSLCVVFRRQSLGLSSVPAWHKGHYSWEEGKEGGEGGRGGEGGEGGREEGKLCNLVSYQHIGRTRNWSCQWKKRRKEKQRETQVEKMVSNSFIHIPHSKKVLLCQPMCRHDQHMQTQLCTGRWINSQPESFNDQQQFVTTKWEFVNMQHWRLATDLALVEAQSRLSRLAH